MVEDTLDTHQTAVSIRWASSYRAAVVLDTLPTGSHLHIIAASNRRAIA